MDPGSPATTTTTPQSEDEECLTWKEFLCIDNAIRRGDLSVLEKYVKPNANGDIRRINLSKDPLLNVMIAFGSNDDILLQLINMTTANNLTAKNNLGDTALHAAAANDRLRVATALLAKSPDLKEMRNGNHETPLLKAAFFGSAKTFDFLLSCGSDILSRKEGGLNVLHCAIVGNNPGLALKIAQEFGFLIYSRNWNSLTPLQVMVTTPNVFRSSDLGPAESLIYAVIPLNSRNESKEHKEEKRDEEAFAKSKPSKYWVEDDRDSARNDKHLTKSEATYFSKRFLKECQRCVAKGAFEVRFFIIFILKKLFKRVEELEKLKKSHVQTMKLIAYLARDPDYWDFFKKGILDDDDESDYGNASFAHDNPDVESDDDEIAPDKTLSCCLDIKNLIMKQNELIKELKMVTKSEKEPELPRWYESPLIVAAKMGLHDFVEQILKVCPQSAELKDVQGRNVLQVAIKYGHVKTVKIIAEMIKGPNPVLPSWLLWEVKHADRTSNLPRWLRNKDDERNEDEEMNSILHYAAETTIKREGLALQMRGEIKWFEMVKDLLPKDLVYSRNAKEKTGQELFDEKHEEMVKSGRNQLMEIGKTCSGLLAAVVFAASFNMPGAKDSDNSTGFSKNNMTDTERNHLNDESVGFLVYTHAYMIGLSMATCSLILFLSLLMSNYRPEAFKKSLPTRCILAGTSFFFALLALLVAFTCNAYLNLYGGERPNTKNLLPLILELTGFPFLWAVVWFFGGFGLGSSDFIMRTLRRR